MARTIFGWTNYVDAAASITATSEVATLPVSNLATWRKGRVWRSMTPGESAFMVAFTVAAPVQVLALAGAAVGDGATIQHDLYDDAGAPMLSVAGGAVVAGYDTSMVVLDAPVIAKSWRCTINAPGRASAGYVDIARAWAGPIWRPSVGISYGWDEGWNDDADNQRGTLSGALFPGDGGQYRTVNVTLDWMSEDDKAQALEMSRVAGRRGQVLHIPDQDGPVPQQAILGHIDKMQNAKSVQDIVPPVYSQSFAIIQDL